MDADAAATRYYRPMRVKSSSRSLSWIRFAAIAFAAFFAGCAQVRYTPPGPEGKPPSETSNAPRYLPVAGQDAATIAELRAAPPKQPEVNSGGSLAGDERTLNARGFARVGTGYFPKAGADAQAWALHQAERIGADKVLIYPVPEGSSDNGDGAQLAFYVRYRLPFGATFRTLTADERRTLGSGGVELGEIVGGTPASEANLQSGDFIVKFNGKPVADRPAFEQLLREHLGQRVTLTITRGSVTMDRLVRLGVVAGQQGEQK